MCACINSTPYEDLYIKYLIVELICRKQEDNDRHFQMSYIAEMFIGLHIHCILMKF